MMRDREAESPGLQGRLQANTPLRRAARPEEIASPPPDC
ncbi:hypothetical protein [Streptomyces sp. DT195]